MISHKLICSLQELEHDLFPEQKRALNIMTEHLIDWDNYFTENVKLDMLCTKDEKFFSKESLHTADLPKGHNWQWNQSRSKKHLSVPGQLDISFCKLNTRKAKGVTTRSPAYKLWIFHLHFINEDSWLHFAWCEKGDTPSNSLSPVPQGSCFGISEQKHSCLEYSLFESSSTLDQINIHDLSFLREFTDIFTAQQLGWVQ